MNPFYQPSPFLHYTQKGAWKHQWTRRRYMVRRLQAYALRCCGLTYKEIAHQMNISTPRADQLAKAGQRIVHNAASKAMRPHFATLHNRIMLHMDDRSDRRNWKR